MAGPNTDFSSNPVWKKGSTQQLRWITDLESYNITLWQQDMNVGSANGVFSIFGCYILDNNGGQVDVVGWIEIVDLNINFVNICSRISLHNNTGILENIHLRNHNGINVLNEISVCNSIRVYNSINVHNGNRANQ
ncbi:MAG: hypothetical protein M1816_001128 [Peltula sp. TS41687]|nr:MAG: hypothetical protein M1816_001128 [Peltula sp. TS41687]